MNNGQQTLLITVVPQSGTDELTGITGTMHIAVTDTGKHLYEFEYSFDNTEVV